MNEASDAAFEASSSADTTKDSAARKQRAVVIGASSGIGRELALLLSKRGMQVCATGRRRELLETLRSELSESSMVREMDVSCQEEAIRAFRDIVDELGGVELVVISAGVGFIDPELSWHNDARTIDVNVRGFTALANAALHQFEAQGEGHLVGISSLAAVRGGASAPAYNASKAFVSSYLEGLRHRSAKSGAKLVVTDIRPGFVDTAMAQGEGLFWVQSPQKAAAQIDRAIRKKRKLAYITKRWRLIAWVLRLLPDALYHRL